MNNEADISIHDNFLVSYEVLCEEREIRFHTEFRDGPGPVEFTDVLFTGVVCYDFVHDSAMGTILFDIVELSPNEIYRQEAEQFQAGVCYGWPGQWGKSADLAAAYFEEHGIRGYDVSSSCGLSGWVLARAMKKVVRPNKDETR